MILETGDPRIHPSKVQRGQRFGRWTVVRYASPAPQPYGVRDGRVYHRRLHVRCVCGFERDAWERDILRGDSRGCRLASCRHAYDEVTMRKVREATDTIAARIARLLEQLDAEREELLRIQAEAQAIVEARQGRKRERR